MRDNADIIPVAELTAPNKATLICLYLKYTIVVMLKFLSQHILPGILYYDIF